VFDRLRDKGFTILYQSHAEAILEKDFPTAADEIERALVDVEVPIAEIIGSGGGEAKGTQRMRRSLAELGWRKTNFEIKKIVNGVEREAISHEIDHVKAFDNGVVALEIEWNNKDPFFDRDLENFKRLHAEGAISVGVIVTRHASLHEGMYDFVLRFAREQNIGSFEDLARLEITPTPKQRQEIAKRVSRTREPVAFAVAWTDKFVADKYGEATTHWRKLLDRVTRGVGNPCPLVLIGLPANIVKFPASQTVEETAAAIETAAIENSEEI
jgi:Restriction endonuclease BglII